jgi:hypothetical protein
VRLFDDEAAFVTALGLGSEALGRYVLLARGLLGLLGLQVGRRRRVRVAEQALL